MYMYTEKSFRTKVGLFVILLSDANYWYVRSFMTEISCMDFIPIYRSYNIPNKKHNTQSKCCKYNFSNFKCFFLSENI